MKNKEIEELLKGMRDVSNTEGCSMNLDRYLVSLLLSYIEQLENNRNEALREIMYLIEEGNIEFFKGKKLENLLMGDNK